MTTVTHKRLAVVFGLLMVLAGISGSAASEPVSGVLHEGTWTKVAQKAKGTWTITEKDSKTTLEISKEFKTKKAPDLKLYLSRKALKDLSGKTATDDAQLIAELKSHKGAQSYEIPEDVDLDEYETLIIHCVKYSKLWCGSALSESEE